MTLRFLALLALLGFAACDAAPGPPDLDATAPVLRAFAFTPDRVVFEDLPAGALGEDGSARVNVSVEVAASDADGSAFAVYFTVLDPIGFDPIAEGQLVENGGVYRATTTLTFAPGATGNYTLLVYAEDADGRLSNQVRGVLPYVVETSNPPSVDAVEGPDTFTPPGTLEFVAAVSDPDGLSNIRRVVVRTPAGQTVDLFDDGQSQGDAAAGDGRYTVRFDVPTGVPPGPQTFVFIAFDRAGLESAPFEKTVTIK